MAYPIPSYLEHPADLAGNMLAGFQAGASVAKAQAQLDQEAQQAGIQMAERQRQMEMQQRHQQQQLEMTRAYHDATVGLRKAQLDQAQQKIQLATVTAARRFQAQQSVQQRTQELVSGGMPIEQATRTAFLENASQLGMTGQGVAALGRGGPSKPAWVPEDLQSGAPGHFETPSGAVHIPTRLREQGKLSQRDILQTLRQQEKELASDPMVKMDIPAKASPTMKAEAERKKAEFKTVRDRIDSMISGAAEPPASMTSKAGKIYQDGKTKWRYTGNSANPLTDKDPSHWEEVK